MGYYQAGDYYGAGDYYRAGGIGSFLKGVARTGLSLVTGGPVAAARTAVTSIVARTASPLVPPPGSPIPGIGGAIARIVPGGRSGIYNRREYTKDGRPRRIRKDGKPWGIPSMDPGNTKALRRAARRMDRFVGIARTALAHTKYGVYTRSSRSSKKRK